MSNSVYLGGYHLTNYTHNRHIVYKQDGGTQYIYMATDGRWEIDPGLGASILPRLKHNLDTSPDLPPSSGWSILDGYQYKNQPQISLVPADHTKVVQKEGPYRLSGSSQRYSAFMGTYRQSTDIQTYNGHSVYRQVGGPQECYLYVSRGGEWGISSLSGLPPNLGLTTALTTSWPLLATSDTPAPDGPPRTGWGYWVPGGGYQVDHTITMERIQSHLILNGV